MLPAKRLMQTTEGRSFLALVNMKNIKPWQIKVFVIVVIVAGFVIFKVFS
jgi:hypothetical protein